MYVYFVCIVQGYLYLFKKWLYVNILRGIDKYTNAKFIMLKFLGVILTLYLCGNFTLKWVFIFENKTNGVNLRT